MISILLEMTVNDIKWLDLSIRIYILHAEGAAGSQTISRIMSGNHMHQPCTYSQIIIDYIAQQSV